MFSVIIILQGLRRIAEEAESRTRCLVQGQGEHVLRGKISALIIFISYYSPYPSGKVIFPVPAGESCENCLHCLTEMGIGVKMNSIVR